MTYILFTKLQEIYINVKWKEYCNIGIKNCGQTRSSIAVILLRNTKLIPVQDTMLDYKYLVKETNAFHIHKSLFFYDFFLKYNVFQEIYVKVNWYTNYSSYLPNHYAMNVFCFYCTLHDYSFKENFKTWNNTNKAFVYGVPSFKVSDLQ